MLFFFSSRRRHTRWPRDWSSDVCSSDLISPPVKKKSRQQPLFKNLSPGELPPLDLLDEPPARRAGFSEDALKAMSRQVELKLADFGVEVEVVAVHPGPVITRFELHPAPGVKGSQISNLSTDLARDRKSTR